jgi:L-alanine-DL-glutamate epimerase-like enolase superfamily enzyme
MVGCAVPAQGAQVTASAAKIEAVEVAAYTIPTDAPESDGTLEWQATTLVLARVRAGGAQGLGYGYADGATALLMRELLARKLVGADALQTAARWLDMARAIRNLGRPGIASMAIATLDAALWDLKGRLLGLPVALLLGQACDAVPVYGSGGFTSYSIDRLRSQFEGWAGQGIGKVKMKVGREPAQDAARVAAAREAVGDGVELFVDANGAYTRKQALAMAERFATCHVSWFEEPVSSDDLEGLRLLRDRAPAGMAITAGEYGYDAPYFRRMLEAGAVDVLQADATRCAGITGFMRVAALAEAHQLPLSSHCAPALHVAPCCCAPNVVHMEYFHDHVRIEGMLFDGVPQPRNGALAPDLSRPGLGLEFKTKEAECYRIL